MVPRDDAYNTVEFKDYYIIKSLFRNFERRFNGNTGKPVQEDFEYNSGTNPWFLTIDEMREMVKRLEAS